MWFFYTVLVYRNPFLPISELQHIRIVKLPSLKFFHLCLFSVIIFLRVINAFKQKGFYGGLDDKDSICNEGNLGLFPELGRSPGKGNGNTLQYFLPGKFHGQRSLVGYSPWDHKELDMTEWLMLSHLDKTLLSSHQ